ncbi:hypothetical protein [Mycolicibacterium stellerae]|uniref:hypothetical protein n=1 Tax=Mycolicibacterium stellerae TaxID=2358193 RepID=UPI0013DDE8DB|nr:hypothetical protein [Mycolicibacterium stellerae]
MAEKGASGDFDYLREETDGSDGVDVVDEGNSRASEADLDYLLADADPKANDGFDAFDENTWDEDFTPVSTTTWHRSSQARSLMIASAVALAAIVVSVVLLVLRGSPAPEERAPSESTPPTTTPLATATSKQPPPPPPAPPPPPPPASTMNEAPAVVRPTVRPRPTKQPEIGVTRTPATRLPISVAPQQRGPR